MDDRKNLPDHETLIRRVCATAQNQLAEFTEEKLLYLVLLNQRNATRSGGYYGALIGDWRRGGIYSSYQAELICRMPKEELAGIIIKAQHNCVSDLRTYTSLKLPRIVHEYLLLWQKRASPVIVLLRGLALSQAQRMSGTWKNIVKLVMMNLGNSASLETIYDSIACKAPDRLAVNPNWKAKVRQVLNQNADLFTNVERGVWALA